MSLFGKLVPDVNTSITFVCTGNICRSAFAEKYLKNILDIDSFRITSLGTHALTGHGLERNTQKYLESKGVLASHQAEQLTVDSDIGGLFIAMSENHREEIIKKIPAASKRVFLLSEFGNICRRVEIGSESVTWQDFINLIFNNRSDTIRNELNLEIDDPFGQEYGFHQEIYGKIENHLKDISTIILKLSI